MILKSHFGHVTSYELTHFKEMVLVWKTKWLLFCLRYDPLIVFRGQNHITFIFIKTMLHDLFVQMAYCSLYRGLRHIDVRYIDVLLYYKNCTVQYSCFVSEVLHSHSLSFIQILIVKLKVWKVGEGT